MLDSQAILDTIKMVIDDIIGLMNMILKPFGYQINIEEKKIDKIEN